MSTPLSSRYEYFDASEAGKWQTLRPGDIASRALHLAAYEDFLTTHYKPFIGDIIEPTEKEIELAEDAKSFVEQCLNVDVDCGVTKVTELLNSRNGAYDAALHNVFVTCHETGTDYGNDIAFGGLLVHEFVHSTADTTAKLIDIDRSGKHDIHVLQPHHLADVCIGFSTESFFEEGFAEEIASRWRERFDPKISERKRDLMGRDGVGEIPVRMYAPAHPIDQTTNDEQRGVQYPAICSFGIQLMSEYTSVDIIQLLIDTRRPESRVEAAYQLKKTVDSIEPGLYDLLTSAEYTLHDFNDALEIIKQAIANHAHEQARAAA